MDRDSSAALSQNKILEDKAVRRHRLFNLILLSILLLLTLCLVNVCVAEEAETIKDAFVKGSVSGTLGNYFEYVSKEAPDANYGWSSTYITLKYETLPWKRLKYGVRFFAHGEMYSDHDNGTEPFDADIEQVITIPEMYFDYGFLEASSFRVGRWNHIKITHFDDAQSEGAYVRFKEIPDTELIIGTIRRFAEIDYDDGEDFGRENDSQDLDAEATFGSGSSSHLVFFEGKYDGLGQISFNPYFIYHDECASVIGLDSEYKYDWDKYEITYGGTVKYYHVNADSAGWDDADVFLIMPEIAKGPFSLEVLYGQYGDGDAYNKPGWLRDYTLLDQTTGAAMPGGEAFETKIKYKQDKYWAHVGYGKNNFETSATKGDGSQEVEGQIGYSINKNLDVNLRYMNVKFDNIDDKDYSKVESRVRFKF